MKINVLGTTYTIKSDVKRADDPILADADGYIDYSTKEIIVEVLKPDVDTFKDMKAYKNKVIRHELVHAFLYESGMSDYAGDETIVDWLAIQVPKIAEVFSKHEVM